MPIDKASDSRFIKTAPSGALPELKSEDVNPTAQPHAALAALVHLLAVQAVEELIGSHNTGLEVDEK